MISAQDVNKEIPEKEAKDVTQADVYNALRIIAKLMLNVRTNQVAIGKKAGVEFGTVNKPSTDTKE